MRMNAVMALTERTMTRRERRSMSCSPFLLGVLLSEDKGRKIDEPQAYYRREKHERENQKTEEDYYVVKIHHMFHPRKT
jgi:hypothetical protein